MAFAEELKAKLEGGESFREILAAYRAFEADRNNDNDGIDDNDDMGDNNGIGDNNEIDNTDENNDHYDEDPGEQETATAIPDEEDEAVFEDEIMLNDGIYDMVEQRVNPEFLSEEIVAFIFAMDMNTAGIFKTEEAIFLYQRLDMLEREDWFDEDTYNSIRGEMKTAEMRERISARAGTVTAILNDAAIRRYKPEAAAGPLF
jgi:hypothetical protein